MPSRVGKMKLCRFFAWVAPLFTLSYPYAMEKTFAFSYSEGAGFYTNGDYKGRVQAASLTWAFNPRFGLDLNRHRFDFDSDENPGYEVYRCEALGHDLLGSVKWDFGRFFSLTARAGASILFNRSERTIATFYAMPEEYDYLSVKLNRFIQTNFDEQELGRKGYRYYVFPPEANGLAHATVTELRDEYFVGIAGSLVPTARYKNMFLSILPNVHWYRETIIYDISLGLGLNISL